MADILDFNAFLSCKKGSKGEKKLNLHLLHLQEQHLTQNGCQAPKLLHTTAGVGGVFQASEPKQTNHLHLHHLKFYLWVYTSISTDHPHKKIRQSCINELIRELFSLCTAWQFLSKLLNFQRFLQYGLMLIRPISESKINQT